VVEELIGQAENIVVLDQGNIAWQGNPYDLFGDMESLIRLRIRPLPFTRIGWKFFKKGWLPFNQIPFNLATAEFLIRRFLPAAAGSPLQKKHSVLEIRPVGTNVSHSSGSFRAILRVENLWYQYPSNTKAGLHNINLTIHQGDFVAVIGPNGADKTTLAKHFNGLLKPKSGRVMVDGINTALVSTSQLAQTVDYVFQNPDHQLFCISVEKNWITGLKTPACRIVEKKRIERILRFLKLEDYRHVHPFKLSKGER